jgi:hypothetical protein
MLTHRLQLLLEERQYRQVEAEAKRCQTSVAAVIRDAIDRRLNDDDARRRAAWEAILAAEPAPVPDDPADIKREYWEDRERRFEEIDRRIREEASGR